jgi:hypothetical protein
MIKELMRKADFKKVLPEFSDKDYDEYLEREKMDMAFSGVNEWRKDNPGIDVTEITIVGAKIVAAQITRDNRANNLEITHRDVFKQIGRMTEARNIQDNFYGGNGFTSCPGDVMTVKQTPGMLSSSISIHITNDGTTSGAAIITNEWLGMANRIEAWEWLKSCNEVHGRKVMIQRGDDTPIPYKESAPYTSRFKT